MPLLLICITAAAVITGSLYLFRSSRASNTVLSVLKQSAAENGMNADVWFVRKK